MRSRGGSRAAGVLVSLVLAGASAAITATDRGSASEAREAGFEEPLPAVFYLPDPDLHPGKKDSRVTKTQLCSKSYRTGTVRPPTSYTNRLKQLELARGRATIKAPNGRTYTVHGEGLPGTAKDYELDHIISLQLGGHPDDPANLWMQPWERKGARLADPGYGAESKDVLESRLKREVCNRGMALSEAQRLISTDWTEGLGE